jgi:hypothetical protein
MKFLLPLIFLFASVCVAQTPAPTTPLPNNWYGAGVAYSAPAYNGWVSYAQQIKAGLYEFTSYDITPAPTATNKLALQTSVRTGFAYLLAAYHNFYIMEFVDGGAAVTSLGNLGGAASLGGAGIYKFKNGFTIEGIYRKVTTSVGSTDTIKEFGIGWAH